MYSDRVKVAFGGVVFLVGCLFALSLLRTILSSHLDKLWKIDQIKLYLLRLGILVLITSSSVYLICTGLRMINPQLVKPFKFGWGRVLFGSWILHSQIMSYYHLLPEGPLPRFEPKNQDQALGMVLGDIAMGLLSVYLIFRGIEAGFTNVPGQSTSSPPRGN